MSKIVIERDADHFFGYFVKVDGKYKRYTFTLWGAKRVATRYKSNTVVYIIEDK